MQNLKTTEKVGGNFLLFIICVTVNQNIILGSKSKFFEKSGSLSSHMQTMVKKKTKFQRYITPRTTDDVDAFEFQHANARPLSAWRTARKQNANKNDKIEDYSKLSMSYFNASIQSGFHKCQLVFNCKALKDGEVNFHTEIKKQDGNVWSQRSD